MESPKSWNIPYPEDPPPMYDSRGRFLHSEVGDWLIRTRQVCRVDGAVHAYSNGLYQPGEDAVGALLVDQLPELSEARRREVYRYLRLFKEVPDRLLAQPRYIPFRSKVYDMKEDEFLDYSHRTVFLSRFPWDYDPEAEPDQELFQTLTDIACGDEDVLQLILEAFGNCFYRVNRFRGAVLLYGPNGSNGKSTLLNMLTQLIGRENASYLSLQDTAQRFRLFDVYGKAANIGDDISDAYFSDTSLFKKLVTGETVLAERKGKDPVSFRPWCKLFFAANTLPPVSDRTRAFFSRILLIPLSGDFSRPDRAKTELKDKRWSERAMMFLTRLAMDALKQLVARGDFTRPACVEEAMGRYQLETDPVLAFLADKYPDKAALDRRPTSQVYGQFRAWCTENGHKNVMTATKFTREVCSKMGLDHRLLRSGAFDCGAGKCFVQDPDEAESL